MENPDWGSYDEYVDNTHDAYEVLVDDDGYITIELTHCSEYVLTMKDVKPLVKKSNEVAKKENSSEINSKSNSVLYFMLGGLVITGIIGGIYFVKFKNNKEKKEAE